MTARIALQSQLDRGGVVALPADLELDGPLVVRGDGVTLRGPCRVRTAGNYVGPLLAVGVQAAPGEFAGAYRPAADAVHDGPAANTFAYDTRASSCLAVTSHPLQYGLLAGGHPDYWETTDPLTVDVMVGRRPGQVNRIVCGLADEWTRGAPWFLVFWESGFYVDIYDNDLGQHRLYIPCPTDPGVYRVSFQLDPASGRAAGWVDRKLVATSVARPWTPGRPLRRHDGLRPFVVGLAAPRVLLGPGAFTDAAFYGLRVARTVVYEWDGPGQTLAARPGTPADDGSQFTSGQQVGLDPSKLVGALDFSGPVTGDPWLKCHVLYGDSLLWWVPAARNYSTADTAVENVTFAGGVQAAVQTHAHYGLRLTDVTATGGQGVGAMPYGPSYPVLFDRCKLSGSDAGLVLWDHMGTIRDLQIPQAGVDAVRAFGGDLVFDRAWLWRTCPATKALFRFVGNEDGGNYVVRDVQCDNEERPNEPSGAVVDCTAGAGKRGRLTVENFNVSGCQTAFVSLHGYGLGPGREPWRVEASGLQAFNGCARALDVNGGRTWFGTVDARALTPPPGHAGAMVAPLPGDPGAKVNVLPPVVGLD